MAIKSDKNITMVLLAAGRSSRMKAIKQLLPWKDGTLLTSAIQTGQDTNVSDILVVLGANIEMIKPFITDSSVHIVQNNQWENGIGTSIACAIKYVAFQNINSDGVLICLADMPFMTTEHLNALIHEFECNNKTIVATKSGNKRLVPVIFDKSYYDELLKLNSDVGAKEILHKHKNKVRFVEVANKREVKDIDTPIDYRENKET